VGLVTDGTTCSCSFVVSSIGAGFGLSQHGTRSREAGRGSSRSAGEGARGYVIPRRRCRFIRARVWGITGEWLSGLCPGRAALTTLDKVAVRRTTTSLKLRDPCNAALWAELRRARSNVRGEARGLCFLPLNPFCGHIYQARYFNLIDQFILCSRNLHEAQSYGAVLARP
jgi:hypothetical protein